MKKIQAAAGSASAGAGAKRARTDSVRSQFCCTPDERWQMNVNFLRSHGLYTRSERQAFGFKSPE
jgi:hypothetical protein